MACRVKKINVKRLRASAIADALNLTHKNPQYTYQTIKLISEF